MRVFPADAFQQHRQLGRCQMDFAVSRRRPDETTALQAFGEQAQAIGVGPQHFNHIAAAPSEDEGLAREGIVTQRILNPRSQPVKAVTHVGDAGHAPERLPAGSDIIGAFLSTRGSTCSARQD